MSQVSAVSTSIESVGQVHRACMRKGSGHARVSALKFPFLLRG